MPVRRKSSFRRSNVEQTFDKAESYTEEQLLAVKNVKGCEDYYEVLGANRDMGPVELRKQYKKLALQLHPDKNKAPGAIEAFKTISNAFSVLNDPISRKKYDMYGLKSIYMPDTVYSHGFCFSQFDDAPPPDMSDTFRPGQTFVRRGSKWQTYKSQATNSHFKIFLFLASSIIIFLLYLYFYFLPEPLYVLQKNEKFTIERRTYNLDAPYYVKSKFLAMNENQIMEIEKEIEENYLVSVRTSCFRERNYKETMIYRAKHFGDKKLELKAQELHTPSCDILNNLLRTQDELIS